MRSLLKSHTHLKNHNADEYSRYDDQDFSQKQNEIANGIDGGYS